jgi:hypothetical protein
MTIDIILVFALVALVIVIKLGLIVLALMLVATWVFGRQAPASERFQRQLPPLTSLKNH